ncbi:MAG: hypothetical protein KatS3mg128_0213 [Silanimonas sp.]|nr:MAG: hypothetical protein KatS3mg128_0213 [Silanimonas sp.]
MRQSVSPACTTRCPGAAAGAERRHSRGSTHAPPERTGGRSRRGGRRFGGGGGRGGGRRRGLRHRGGRRSRGGGGHGGRGHRGDGGSSDVRRIDQGGELAHHAAPPPVGLEQEGDEGVIDPVAGGDPHHRLTAGIAAHAELQVGGDTGGSRQAHALEGLRRCQTHAQGIQFARGDADQGDLGHQRLVELRFHFQRPQAQGLGLAGGQCQGRGQREELHRVLHACLHGRGRRGPTDRQRLKTAATVRRTRPRRQG